MWEYIKAWYYTKMNEKKQKESKKLEKLDRYAVADMQEKIIYIKADSPEYLAYYLKRFKSDHRFEDFEVKVDKTY